MHGRSKSSCGNEQKKIKISVARKVIDGNKKAIWLDSVVHTHDYVHSYTKPLRSTELLVCCRNCDLLLPALFNLLF